MDRKDEDSSTDMKFASAVAMFAQLLKDSSYKGTTSYNDVIQLANNSLGNDKNGYRKEFVKLVGLVNNLN